MDALSLIAQIGDMLSGKMEWRQMKNEQLRRDIDGLKESICLNWQDMANLPMSGEDRRATRESINSLITHLKERLNRMDGDDANGS